MSSIWVCHPLWVIINDLLFKRLRPCLEVHKRMEMNGMHLSKGKKNGKEWNVKKLSNLNWIF